MGAIFLNIFTNADLPHFQSLTSRITTIDLRKGQISPTPKQHYPICKDIYLKVSFTE